MRPLELILALVSVLSCMACMAGRDQAHWARWSALFTAGVLVAHLWAEGARWHLGPVYLLAVWGLSGCIWPATGNCNRWTLLVALGLATTTIICGSLLPVFRFPGPTGTFRVGTTIRFLVNRKPDARQPETAPGIRELMIQIWYPTDVAGRRQAYRSRTGLSLKKKHLALVTTGASADVPVSAAQPAFPLIVFSPAWHGNRWQNTVQVQELASHGFVVVGIDHPFATELTVFPDGRTIPSRLGKGLDFRSDEGLRDSLEVAQSQLITRTADVRFVLDALQRIHESDPHGLLTGRLDMTRVGVFGHSFGGAVAAEVCCVEPRCKAGVNLDGYIYGLSAQQAIGKPFLHIFDATPMTTPDDIASSTGARHRLLAFDDENAQCIRRSLAGAPGYWIKVLGSTHANFCDSAFYTPLRRLSGAGPISPERAAHLVNVYLVSFFRRHLTQRNDGLLDAPSPSYPEVVFVETWHD